VLVLELRGKGEGLGGDMAAIFLFQFFHTMKKENLKQRNSNKKTKLGE